MSRERGNKLIADGLVDLVALGEKFIGNPDLPARFAALARWTSPTAPRITHRAHTAIPTIRRMS